MELRGPVLCATSLSEADGAALRQGRALASQLGTRFIVCHVLPEAFAVRVLFPQEAGVDQSFQAALEAKASAAVRAHVTAAIGDDPAAAPIDIETGTSHGGILSAADRLGAGMIVLGPGATAHRVARSASGPVLIARPSPTGGTVLGATDLSDPSFPAMHAAAGEARRRSVRLRVLHCLDLGETASLAGVGLPGTLVPWPPPQAALDQLEAAARARLVAAVHAIEPTAEPIVLRRPPAAGIVEAASDVATALVVVGTRGRTGLARLALGSVAEAVIDAAPCSVLVVPLHPD